MSESQSEGPQPAKLIDLTIRAADSMTEIFLVDSGFQRIAGDVGLLKTEVPPGIYKARFRAGQSQTDRFIEIEEGSQPVVLDGPAVEFVTPVPLPQTVSNRAVHQAAAEKFSRTVTLSPGSGSQLYLFIRELSEEPARPWLDVSLHDINGNLLVRAEQGECDRKNGFCALNLELDPSTYRLRVEEEPGEIYEMFIVTVAGWQTQVFALAEEAWLPGIDACRAALPTAAVLMAKQGKGFDPADVAVRQTELIRLGLLNSRKLLTEDVAKNLLQEKTLNPMAIIFAAHLLLRDNFDNSELLAELTARIRESFLVHPDVRAVQLHPEAGDNQSLSDFPTPPMLHSSQQCIVQATARGESVIPHDSLSERITDGVLKTSLWLIHRLDSADM